MNGVTTAGLWQMTRAVVQRHFNAFATLAAAFAFLPSLAFRLLAPDVGPLPTLGGPAPQLPAFFWLFSSASLLLQSLGLFTIAAVAADPLEGGARSLGTILRETLPALVRFIGAVALSYLVAMVAGIVLVIMLAIVLVFAGVTATAATSGAAAPPTPEMVRYSVIGLAILLPLLVWLQARLSPLVGVYLRETTGIVAGLRRAWQLSRGATAPLVAAMVAYLVASVGLGALGLMLRGAIGNAAIAQLLLAVAIAAAAALLYAYFGALLGVVYRQLAGKADGNC